MNSTSYFATGSRKSATAKVWLIAGQNEHTVNGRPLPNYFGREDLVKVALSPLQVSGVSNFGVKSVVAGGGLSAQAAAVALGIARALLQFNPELRGTLKAADLLKRDPREKERMKYGLAKRRKRFQWTKR
ncbi:MAG: 30S ribosomal protein S9 [candidate division WOR-3 bacterium]|jgi:small subunit ribosomal protein S9